MTGGGILVAQALLVFGAIGLVAFAIQLLWLGVRLLARKIDDL